MSEVSSNQAPLIEAPTNRLQETTAQLLFIPACLVVIAWTVSFSKRLNWRKTASKKLDTIKPSSQIPCSSCRFFKNEPYLKCAVHPLKVGSAEAMDCPDLWSLDSNKFDH
ncbi:hypothetical protein H6F98_19015 [Microcoleus sp. FACHB-SPT15]|uniref:hypothetical protein n=1 Tax=Microcoleus sp. FACHB-SPT15 TaxID=2692830 RepID=UPI00178047FA|nr:hypothetical protein [Microcoleus sp. FACHB-SPT15]MBD1807520.1 hypothetical protein [Microcoleus sp. FACHB-SPT15]